MQCMRESGKQLLRALVPCSQIRLGLAFSIVFRKVHEVACGVSRHVLAQRMVGLTQRHFDLSIELLNRILHSGHGSSGYRDCLSAESRCPRRRRISFHLP